MSKKNDLYRQLVVKCLYFNQLLSCSEISAKLNLSLPLINRLLEELVEDGVVLEQGYAPSTGGRRPLTYTLNPGVFYVVAVAMDQFITRVAIMDLHNRLVGSVKKIELSLPSNDRAKYILCEAINEVIDEGQIAREKILGVGIGMPGFVDGIQGLNYSFLEVNDQSLERFLSDKIGLPVSIDNDSRLIALAELRFGVAKKSQNAMVINIGWGIGLGLIVNNKLFRGHDGFAGELSHIPLFTNNKLCGCGKRGCLETESSLAAMVEKAIEGITAGRISSLSDKELSVDHFERSSELVIEAAKKGDQYAIELISEIAYNIGRGVAILIHLFNPQLIILSGRGSLVGKLWQAPIQQAINEHCIPRLASNTEIKLSGLGYEAELIGSASLVMDNYEKHMLKGSNVGSDLLYK